MNLFLSLLIFTTPCYIAFHFVQDGRCIGPNASNEPESTISQNSVTRKAGGVKPKEKEMQVSAVRNQVNHFLSTSIQGCI